MGDVIVRDLDDEVIASLRRHAEERGRSLEREAREILTAASAPGRRARRSSRRSTASAP